MTLDSIRNSCDVSMRVIYHNVNLLPTISPVCSRSFDPTIMIVSLGRTTAACPYPLSLFPLKNSQSLEDTQVGESFGLKKFVLAKASVRKNFDSKEFGDGSDFLGDCG